MAEIGAWTIRCRLVPDEDTMEAILKLLNIWQDDNPELMVSMLTGYTVTARNKHDDVPDGMAMLALYVQSLTVPKVTVMQRPW